MNAVMPYLRWLYLGLLAANVVLLCWMPFRKYGLFLLLISWALFTAIARPQLQNIDEQYGEYCYRAYHFGEILLMTAIYSQLSITKPYRAIFLLMAAVYFCFMIWFYTYIKPAGEVNFIDFAAGGIIIGFYAVLFLYKWYQNYDSSDVINRQLAFFNITTLIYYALNISIMGVKGLINQRQPGMAESLHNITRLTNLPLYIIYFIIFLRLYQSDKLPSGYAI